MSLPLPNFPAGYGSNNANEPKWPLVVEKDENGWIEKAVDFWNNELGAAAQQEFLDGEKSYHDGVMTAYASGKQFLTWGGSLDVTDWGYWVQLHPGVRLFMLHTFSGKVRQNDTPIDTYFFAPLLFYDVTVHGGSYYLLSFLTSSVDSLFSWKRVLLDSPSVQAVGAKLTSEMSRNDSTAFHDIETAWFQAAHVANQNIDPSGAGINDWVNSTDVGTRLIYYTQAAEKGDRTGDNPSLATIFPARLAQYFDTTNAASLASGYAQLDKFQQLYQTIAARNQAQTPVSTTPTGVLGGNTTPAQTANSAANSSSSGLGYLLLGALALLGFGGKKK